MAKDISALKATAADHDRILIEFFSPVDEATAETALENVVTGRGLQAVGAGRVEIHLSHRIWHVEAFQRGRWVTYRTIEI